MKNRTNPIKTTTAGPCIWMQAGVAKKKKCTHYFDCITCKYDAGMKKMAVAGKHLTWQESMRRLDSKERTCRHALTGRTSHRICPMNYNCGHCDFDQTFEDSLSSATAAPVKGVRDIKGFKMPIGYYFHSGHTWARIEAGGILRIGMDDFSFKVLGGPDRMELPLMGQELHLGRTGWGLGRQDNTADVLSPVSGVITRVNTDAGKHPGRMGDDPYSENWLFTVHNSDLTSAVSPLMVDEKSDEWLDSEIISLEKMIEDTAGPMATDGGLLRPDVYGAMPALGWDRLVNRFLGT